MTKSNTNKRVNRRNLKWFILLYTAAIVAAILIYLVSEAVSHIVIDIIK